MEDDTKLRKIFVGSLKWETDTDRLIGYFIQFGEIVEANVVIDKGTGRSRGYGFVTFKTAESATRALQDKHPEIDGRRTDCRLAYLGSRNPSLRHGMGSSSQFHQQHTGRFAFPYSTYGFSLYWYPMAGTGLSHSQYNAAQNYTQTQELVARVHAQVQAQAQV